MVIQSNMSPKAIVEVWENTAPIFVKFNISLSEKPLETLFQTDTLTQLLVELNSVVGSSAVTCIEGG